MAGSHTREQVRAERGGPEAGDLNRAAIWSPQPPQSKPEQKELTGWRRAGMQWDNGTNQYCCRISETATMARLLSSYCISDKILHSFF